MDLNNPRHLEIAQNIEAGLKIQYELHPDLTDSLCVLALDNAKIAIKKQSGYAKNESVTDHPMMRGVIDWCVTIGLERINTDNGVSLKEFLNLLDTVKRSVARHSADGSRAYYEFIRGYV